MKPWGPQNPAAPPVAARVVSALALLLCLVAASAGRAAASPLPEGDAGFLIDAPAPANPPDLADEPETAGSDLASVPESPTDPVDSESVPEATDAPAIETSVDPIAEPMLEPTAGGTQPQTTDPAADSGVGTTAEAQDGLTDQVPADDVDAALEAGSSLDGDLSANESSPAVTDWTASEPPNATVEPAQAPFPGVEASPAQTVDQTSPTAPIEVAVDVSSSTAEIAATPPAAALNGAASSSNSFASTKLAAVPSAGSAGTPSMVATAVPIRAAPQSMPVSTTPPAPNVSLFHAWPTRAAPENDLWELATASAIPSAGMVLAPRIPNPVAVAVEFGRAGNGWAGALVFNVWLRRELRERRISQRQLAHLAGIHHSTISRLLKDGRAPSLDTATKLAHALRLNWTDERIAAYFDLLSERPLEPAQRVEGALRGDPDLGDDDVRALMHAYLTRRAHKRVARGP